MRRRNLSGRLAIVIVIALASITCGRSAGPKRQALQAGDLAIVGATIVPMDRDGAVTGRTVVVRGDRIVLVAPASAVDTTGATLIDAAGKWLVPGLADMHVHTWVDRDFPMYLLNGVTTIRDMYGSPGHLAWRAAIAEGKLLGPTLFTAGPIVDGDPPTWPGSAVVTTAEAARTVVRDQKKAGYDLIKVYGGLSVEAYTAIVEEAKAQGIPFAGHVPAAVGIEQALASGQRSIEHLDGYLPFRGEPRIDDAIIAATVKAGVWNSPTLVVMERFGRLDDPAALETTAGLQYVSAPVRAQWNPQNDFRLKKWTPEMFEQMRAKDAVRRKLVADLARAGARLVLGTDTGNPFVVPGFAVHDELALLVAAGLTPAQALRTATVAPAELVDQPGKFGVIAPGARADLLVVDRDPLLDVGALAKPSHVIVRGKVHTRDELLAIVDKPPDAAVLPELEVEGTRLADARYEIAMNGTVIGRERALISKLADGTRVVRGQAAYETPAMVIQYRATADRVEYADGLAVTRSGAKVIATPREGTPIELATTADAVIAPQAVAEFVWYADRLATLKVGAAKTITAAAVMVEAAVALEPATLTFKRLPDADGRRRYDVTGTHSKLDLTGTFSVDPDGAPHEITVTLKWGTFVTRRLAATP